MFRAVKFSALCLLWGATCARADCAADFAAAMNANKAAGPYHTETQMMIDGETRTLISEVILPDKIHIIKDFMDREFLLTANGAWTKLGSDWMEIPDKKRDEILDNKNYSLSSGFKAAQNVQCLGPQPVEGKTLTAFAFDMVNTKQNNTHIAQMVYLDDKGVPAILTSDFAIGTHKTHTLAHVSHDTAITIEAPAASQAAAATPAAAALKQADAKCIAEMKSITDAMTAAGPQRYAIVDNGGGKPVTITLELIPGSAMHMAWDGGEQIVNLAGGWMKDGGAWKPLPAGAITEGLQELKNPWWAKPESLSNLQCLGAQAFEGQPLPANSFDLDRFLGAKALQHVTLFKGKDNLPVALSVLKEGQNRAEALVVHVTFDKAIKIEAPK